MSKIIWDQEGTRYYETGINQGVLYVLNSGVYGPGVAWNGLISITESPSGAEPTPIYADNIKYLNLMSAEEFGATIEAYTYPDEFGACDGTASLADGVTIGQQRRKTFGLSYRTVIGNDVEGQDLGYKLHLIYGALAAPSEKGYQTINESPDAITFSWEISTTPVEVPGKKPTACITIDSTKVDSVKLAALETILYGTASVEPRLPLPAEIIDILGGSAPAALAISTSVPTEGQASVAVASSITLTFNNKIQTEDIVLMTAAGVVVPVTKTFDSTGKILTIKPKSSMAATTQHLIVLAGVGDIYGQSLAPAVRKFTTA